MAEWSSGDMARIERAHEESFCVETLLKRLCTTTLGVRPMEQKCERLLWRVVVTTWGG